MIQYIKNGWEAYISDKEFGTCHLKQLYGWNTCYTCPYSEKKECPRSDQ